MNEATVLVDGQGDWWIYVPDQDAWAVSHSGPSEALQEALEEWGGPGAPYKSTFRGFDAGAQTIAEMYDIASPPSGPPHDPDRLIEWLLA